MEKIDTDYKQTTPGVLWPEWSVTLVLLLRHSIQKHAIKDAIISFSVVLLSRSQAVLWWRSQLGRMHAHCFAGARKSFWSVRLLLSHRQSVRCGFSRRSSRWRGEWTVVWHLWGAVVRALDFHQCCMPGARGVLPYKGLMGTCGQLGYVIWDFCLKQSIEIIIFCLNQGIDLSILVLNMISFLRRLTVKFFQALVI